MAGGGIGEAALLGAALGGGASAISGRDPLEGAILGGLTGGIGSGIMGGLGAEAALTGAEAAAASEGATAAGGINDLFSNMAASGAQPVPPTPPLYEMNALETADVMKSIRPEFTNSLAPTPPAGEAAMPAGVPEGYTGNVARASMNYVDPVDALKPVGDVASSGSANPLKAIYDVYKQQDPLTQGVMKYGGMGLGGLGAVKMLSRPTSVAGQPKYSGSLSRYSMSDAYQPYTYKPYAEGGPVEQMSDENAVGANTGYPQAYIKQGAYATPWQTPVSRNVVADAGDANVDQMTGAEKMAGGGIASLGGYSDGGRLLRGPGDGMSDNIPAMIGRKQPARLADGEFVVPADVVSGLGNGSTDAGAKQLYKMLDKVRTARTGTKKQGKAINPNKLVPA